jgi:radical SAM superfamily enzyme YgiQ (UPF0313 family)
MRYKRLILAALDWAKPKEPPFSLASASIIARMQREPVEIVHQTWRVNHASFNASTVTDFVLKQSTPNSVVAFGAYTWNDAQVVQITRELKHKGFPGVIVIGGPQVSYTKQGLEKYFPHADFFIRGYAEQAMARLMQGEKVIKGVHKAGDFDLNLTAHVDLEDFPSPFLTGVIPPQHFIRWETQRGCPFSCRFCQYQEAGQKKLARRFLNQERIYQEVEWICKNGIKDIHVVDATFNSSPDYINVIRRFAELKYSGKIALQTRTEMIVPEFLDAIAQLNQTGMVVLELGLQTTSREEQKIIDRPNNLAKFSRMVMAARSRGIELEVSLIFGLPQQTVSSFQESIQFCQSLGIPVIYGFPLMLHRGTWLWEQQHALGLKTDEQIADPSIPRLQEGVTHVISSPTFSYADWRTMAAMAASLNVANEKHI